MSYELTQRAKALLTSFLTEIGYKLDGKQVTIKSDRRGLAFVLDVDTTLIMNGASLIYEQRKTTNPVKHDIFDVKDALSLIFDDNAKK